MCIRDRYVVAYLLGEWSGLSQLYQEILEYASCHHLNLIGYAYEDVYKRQHDESA